MYRKTLGALLFTLLLGFTAACGEGTIVDPNDPETTVFNTAPAIVNTGQALV